MHLIVGDAASRAPPDRRLIAKPEVSQEPRTQEAVLAKPLTACAAP